MAAECGFETAARGDAVDGGDDGFRRVLDVIDHFRQAGLGGGFRRVEFGDVGAARKHAAGAGDDDGIDAVIVACRLDGLHQTLAYGETETIDRRIVEGEDGHAVARFAQHCIHDVRRFPDLDEWMRAL